MDQAQHRQFPRVLQKKQPRQGEKRGRRLFVEGNEGQVYLHERNMPMLCMFRSRDFIIDKRLDAVVCELVMSFTEK